jgi:predicted DNA repair protein MutK
VITLSIVIEQTLPMQIMVGSVIALIATVDVYELVALIVRMDDMGLTLIDKSKIQQGIMAKISQLMG